MDVALLSNLYELRARNHVRANDSAIAAVFAEALGQALFVI